jgi:uncharacterized RDD family membrane protein YckC
MEKWYYVEDGVRRGPVTDIELRSALKSGKLAPDTPVHTQGMNSWVPASRVPQLLNTRSGSAMPQADESDMAKARGLLAGLSGNVEYADFARRTMAVFVDIMVVWLVVLLVRYLFELLTGASTPQEIDPTLRITPKPGGGPSFSDTLPALQFIFSVEPAWLALAFVTWFVCSVLFETSSWQATPGKRFLGLEVTDEEGQRISFTQSLIRTSGKVLSAVVVGAGYILGAVDSRRQTLHDKLAKTLVICE